MYKLFVALENVRSAYNVGSVFRTADSAGVEKLFLTGFTPHPPHPKLNKTALGSIQTVNWEYHETTLEFLKQLKSKNIKIISMESIKGAPSLFEARFTQDTCLIFGHEETGISQEVLFMSDQILTIPMFGVKESLNIASAAAIAIYEYRRKLLLEVDN